MLLPPLKRDQQNCQINDDYYMVNMDTFNVLPRRFYREHSFESVYRHDSGRFYREHSFESVYRHDSGRFYREHNFESVYRHDSGPFYREHNFTGPLFAP